MQRWCSWVCHTHTLFEFIYIWINHEGRIYTYGVRSRCSVQQTGKFDGLKEWSGQHGASRFLYLRIHTHLHIFIINRLNRSHRTQKLLTMRHLLLSLILLLSCLTASAEDFTYEYEGQTAAILVNSAQEARSCRVNGVDYAVDALSGRMVMLSSECGK